MFLLISLLIFISIFYMSIRLIMRLWYKMHEWVGIEVGTSRFALSHTPVLKLPQQHSTPVSNNFFHKREQFDNQTQRNTARHHHNNYNRAIQATLGIDKLKLNRMPTQAVLLLDNINEKLHRYYAWQKHNATNGHESNQWLTEHKFVINRLVEETIPQTVNQYDQIALFHPKQLEQKIHNEMTASELLIDVLQQVDTQLDTLLNELFDEASQQLSTTYRYVKTRIQK